MSEEILMNITPTEVRVALIDNGILQELHIERTRNLGIVGNIYHGKVLRVLPGMQAAFVDIGLAQAAFIHASEIMPRLACSKTEPITAPQSIHQLIHEGQSLVVQVIKDPIGTKGARLTTHLSIPARYLVLIPNHPHIGISLRIEDTLERDRLKALVEHCAKQQINDEPVGFILRTAAEGASQSDIENDTTFLSTLWQHIQKDIQTHSAPALVYEDLPLSVRTIRDLVNPNIESIKIDDNDTFEAVQKFVKKLVPHLDGCIERYTGTRTLFDRYGIEEEINRSLERKVLLKSGGHVMFDQTEAMTTIDVNTGSFVGHRNLEETIFKTNLEAATALARQLRIRNLGGIIIIDFIDMMDPEHQRQVVRTLEKALSRDYAKTNVTGLSELGLVAMTRKRTRESLEHILCSPCPTCQGRSMLKTAETVCYEVFREILREAQAYDNDRYLVRASQSVVDRLVDEESGNMADLEKQIGRTIEVQVEPIYTQEQFDVVLL